MLVKSQVPLRGKVKLKVSVRTFPSTNVIDASSDPAFVF